MTVPPVAGVVVMVAVGCAETGGVDVWAMGGPVGGVFGCGGVA